MTNNERDDLRRQAELHTAGATVRHNSPFKDLPSHANDTALPVEFIKEWVIPYYMIIAHYDKDWIPALEKVKPSITKDICLRLLGDFNWRSRLVGSYFAAIKGYADIIGIIGIHLLQSEVCCVGRIYTLTLAFFNTSESVKFLNTYLDYYLTKPDFHFDQGYVMQAIIFLDKINDTSNAEKHAQSYFNLMRSWKNPEILPSTEFFEEQIPIMKILSTGL